MEAVVALDRLLLSLTQSQAQSKASEERRARREVRHEEVHQPSPNRTDCWWPGLIPSVRWAVIESLLKR